VEVEVTPHSIIEASQDQVQHNEATAGRFRSANSTLAFLGSALGMGLADEAIVRQTPEGHWWAEIAVPAERIASLIWTSGGVPFGRMDQVWAALSPTGKLPDIDDREKLAVDDWPVVELVHLLAETRLSPRRYRGAVALNVIAPGQLGRWVLRRATALGLNVTIVPSLCQPLAVQDGPEQSVSLLRLQSDSARSISAAFVHSITNLPYVIVAETSGSEFERILVDVRHRLPISPAIIGGMVPEGESWVLGPPDVGHWRLRRAGQEVDGASLLETDLIGIAAPLELPPATQTKPIPVRLIARPQTGRRVDAVLLDDTELNWLRLLLSTFPSAEMSFLLPGPGVHLLTAPGGLPTSVPFGVPLIRTGPGALYIELGRDFYPPLPDSARQERFQLDENTAVVVLTHSAFRFDASLMTPSWTLWVGEAPPVQQGLSGTGKRLLGQISAAIRESEVQRHVVPMRERRLEVSRTERTRLLERAQRAEIAGRIVEAAELLERAGYPGPAGRLYEKAARRGY
jgi:hypothetical protein